MLVVHGTLITQDKDNRLLYDSALRIEGARIMDIGSSATLCSRYPDEERLDARSMLVMPGMISAHTHFCRILGRGIIPLDLGASSLWRRFEAALGYEDIRYGTLMSCAAAIRNGTTTLFDYHASPSAIGYSLDAVAEAVVQSGVRACLVYGVTERDGVTKARQGIQENARFAKRSREEPLLAAAMGLEASVSLSDETLASAVGAAALSGVGFYVSAGGDLADARGPARQRSLGVIERCRRFGVLGPRTLLADLVDASPDEISMIRKAKAWVVHNSRSTIHRGGDRALLARFLEGGLAVCLGNDDFSSNIFYEMQATHLLHGRRASDSGGLSADSITHLALKNNAAVALRTFMDRLGELTVGALADVILVDCVSPTPVTEASLPWYLLTALDGGHVDTTIVGGRVLMRHGSMLTIDERPVAARARWLAQQLRRRL